ncbi:MAG: DICT sensory domain-containing protein [Haloarculaceae archaeon]
MVADGDDTARLQDIVYTVDERIQTLVAYNLSVPERVASTLADYFDGQSVTLRRGQTDSALPKNFMVLHDGEQFVAASPVRAVYDAVRRQSDLVDETDPAGIEIPAVVENIDETAFTSYDKARMIGASRRIERHAWEEREGELHAGFQRLSNARDQWRLYTRLASRVETHVYGAPDWSIPPTDIAVHTSDAVEITDTWFVVYDGDEEKKRALLAEERGPGRFHGFWTDHPTVVDAVLDRLRAVYPSTPTTS